MNIQEYIKKVGDRYKLGNATEHSYRCDLEQLISSLVPDVVVTNEPSRIVMLYNMYLIV